MKPLAVYVHIPFCTVKCGYCDFNAYAGMDALKSQYAGALVHEIGMRAALVALRPVATVAFGGGTPGEFPAAAIGAVVDAVRRQPGLEPDAEVSLEANPGTCDGPYLRALRAAGVTRLSLGAQSFDADELRFLDRIHSTEAIEASAELARSAGFASINLDLIYGIPGQTLEGWSASLRRALALRPDHLSLYALTIEPGTPLALRVERGEVAVPDDDQCAAMYELATDHLARAGFEQYEISNWARAGHRSRHNQVYWTDGEYVGLGAGAHGFVDGERYANVAHPRAYLHSLAGDRLPVESAYRPGRLVAIADWLTLRLRMLDGFAPDEFARRFGLGLERVVGPPLSECAAAGILEVAPRVRLTRRGRMLHGEVAARLLAHLQGLPQMEC